MLPLAARASPAALDGDPRQRRPAPSRAPTATSSRATRVDAVEIDPELTEVGRRLFDLHAPAPPHATPPTRGRGCGRTARRYDVDLRRRLPPALHPVLPGHAGVLRACAATSLAPGRRGDGQRRPPGGLRPPRAGPLGDDGRGRSPTSLRDPASDVNTQLIASDVPLSAARLARRARRRCPPALRPVAAAHGRAPGARALRGGSVYTDDVAPVEWLIDASIVEVAAEGGGDGGGRRARPQRPSASRTLELFFDLVFVFTITQLTSVLAHDPTWAALCHVALMLGVIWCMYGGYAWLTNAVATDRPRPRRCCSAGMAGTSCSRWRSRTRSAAAAWRSALGYLVARASSTPGCSCTPVGGRGARRSCRSRRSTSPARCSCWSAGRSAATRRYVPVAAVALLVVDRRRGDRHRRASTSAPAHFVERHGLVVIVAIGESVVAIGHRRRRAAGRRRAGRSSPCSGSR